VFTVCPKCTLTLAVTAADLRVGQGYVRCGRCANVFNALVSLQDDRRSTPRAEGEPPTPVQALAPETPAEADTMLEFHLEDSDLQRIFVEPSAEDADAPTGTFETIVLEGEGALATEEWVPEDQVKEEIAAITRALDDPRAGARPLAAANDDLQDAAAVARDATASTISGTIQTAALADVTLPDDAEGRSAGGASLTDEGSYIVEEAAGEPPLRQREAFLAGLGAAALGVLLLVQVAHHYRNQLAALPAWNGPLTRFYAAIGAPLAPRWNVAGYDVRQQGAVGATGPSGKLVVRASIQNGAERAQPLPLVRLTLLDRYGKRVASRDLAPAEYAEARAARGAFLAAGERLDAEFAVVDPGRNAVGFELDACLPVGDGSAVRCASDTRNR
jgi:predicted Zn finger-like uncharacterized protein